MRIFNWFRRFSAEGHAVQDPDDQQRLREKHMIVGFWIAFAAGLLTLAAFAVGSTPPVSVFQLWALTALVAGGTAIIGAVFGSLFGLPRGSASLEASQSHAPSMGLSEPDAAVRKLLDEQASRVAQQARPRTDLVGPHDPV